MSDLKPEQILKARQEGRMEALAIILREDAESPFHDKVIYGPNDETGDYSTYWNEEALRKLLHVDDNAYNAFDKAEEQYWDYRGYALECEIAATERRTQPEATAPAQDLAQEQAATMLIQRKKIQTLNVEIAELQKKLSGVNSAAHRLAARLCAIPPAKTIRGNDLITREAVMGFVVEWRRQWNEANEAAFVSSANALSAGDRVDAERYRFLRDHGVPETDAEIEKALTVYQGIGENSLLPDELDAAIDSAIQAQKDGHG